MIENLTPAQQVFSVFYAIFFGIMLSTVGARRSNPRREDPSIDKSLTPEEREELEVNVTLNLFDTPSAWAIGPDRGNKPLWRFFISLLMINIFPGLVFALVFYELGQFRNTLNIFQILILVWISLAPNNIYRIYLGVLVGGINMLYLKGNKTSNSQDLNARSILKNERIDHQSQKRVWNHIAIPIFWYLPVTVLLFYLAFNTLFNHDPLHYFLLISSVVLFYIGGIGAFWFKQR